MYAQPLFYHVWSLLNVHFNIFAFQSTLISKERKWKQKVFSISEHTTEIKDINKDMLSVRWESVCTGKTSMAVKCTDSEFESDETELQKREHSEVANTPRVGRQNLFQSNRTDVWHSILGVPPERNNLPDRTLFWNLISWRRRLMVWLMWMDVGVQRDNQARSWKSEKWEYFSVI